LSRDLTGMNTVLLLPDLMSKSTKYSDSVAEEYCLVS
jgi:hypothetical protein